MRNFGILNPKFLCSLFVLFGVSTGMAQSFELSFKAIDNSKAKITLTDVHNQSINIKVKNSFGAALVDYQVDCKQHCPDGIYEQISDLGQYNDGKYSLYVSNGSYKVSWPFFVEDHNVYVKTTSSSNAPVSVNMNGSDVVVSFINSEKDVVKLQICDNMGSVLFESKPSRKLNIQRRYDLSKLGNGQFNIKLLVGTREYAETVVVENR